MRSGYRALWLSDIYLGSTACRAEDLLKFLANVSADKIYLIGDIIDLERIKTRGIFPDAHRKVLSRFLQIAKAGSEIVYVPGRHDSQLRYRAGKDVFGVPVRLEAQHLTRDGRRLLVMHGDQLDQQVRQGTSLEQFDALSYRVLVNLDAIVDQMRSRLDREYLSISAGIKQRLNSAMEYICRFEDIAARHAAERGFDGVICGYIHRPCVRDIDGVRYANDGDWIEQRTAIAETVDGRLQLLQWQATASAVRPGPHASPLAA